MAGARRRRRMLGRKVFAPKLFYRFSLEAQVPEGHLLRRVAAAVDFAFVRRLTARFYSHTGRPGLDPVVLFKLGLLGYLYGITSERRLAEEVRLHLAYRWFLGYDLDEATPDHSVLSKARARFGLPVYQAFFAEIVRQCARAGLVHGDVLYVDSTLVEANASLQSAGARALLAQLPSATGYVEAVWQENPAPASSGAGRPAGGPRRRPAGTPAGGAAPAERAAGPPLHVAGPEDAPNGRQGTVNDLVVSRTDPEAGLVKRVGIPSGFSYKVHLGRGRRAGAPHHGAGGDLGRGGGRAPAGAPAQGARRDHRAHRRRGGGGHQVRHPRQLRGPRAGGDPGQHPVGQRRAPAGRLRGRPLRLRGRRRPLPVPHRPAPHPLRRLAHGRPGRRRRSTAPARRCAAPARSGPSAARARPPAPSSAPTTRRCATASRPTCAPGRPGATCAAARRGSRPRTPN